MIVMTSGKERHTWFKSFKLKESEHKDPMVISDHCVESTGSNSTSWIHQGQDPFRYKTKPTETINGLDIKLKNLKEFVNIQSVVLDCLESS